MNVLLVGLGRWGEKHLRVLRALGAAAWVADVAADRRGRAIEHGVAAARVVSDYREALPHVDAVDIVTPADTHLAIATTSLAAGRPCFIEKPLATTVEDSLRLVAAADAAGRLVQVGHIFRFHPVTAVVRAVLDESRLGRVRYATGRFSGFKRPRTDVGVTQSDALHYFDLFAYLFRRPATAVSSLQQDFLGRGLDDRSVTTVSYGDITGTVEADYFGPGTYRDYVVVTERGAVVADYLTSTVRLFRGEHIHKSGEWEARDSGKEELPVSRAEPLHNELAAFVHSCKAGSPSPVDVHAGLHAVQIVEAAERSARLGRVVTLTNRRTG